MKNPYRTLSRREIYRHEIVTVEEARVLLPTGSEIDFAVLQIKPGVTVLALDQDNTVHATREYRYAIDRPSLELISGGMEEGEEPLDTAKREIAEEAGLAATEWTYLGYVDPFTSMVLYCCTPLA